MKVIEILNELRMSPKAFQATLAQHSDKVHVGYEVECIIPLDQYNIEKQRDSKHINDIWSLNTLDSHFSTSYSQRNRFNQLYDEYVARLRDEEREKFLDANANEYDSKEELEQVADDYIRDEFEEPSEEDYIEDVFGDYTAIINEFNWKPDYGWVPGHEGEWFYTEDFDDNSTDAVYEEMKKDLQKYIGSDLHTIIDDGSIDHPDDDIGAEIITKPLPLKRALQTLSKIFTWLQRVNGYTNLSTGLHVNISIEGKPEIDWLKLGLFLGEKHVLKSFDRLSNTYTTAQLQKLTASIRNLSPQEASFIRGYHQKYTLIETVIAKLNELLSRDKYSSYNISKYPNKGYVEFRMPGGEDYERDFNKIENMTLRFVRAMTVAADPEAHKQEYYKKIAQYIQRALRYSNVKQTTEKPESGLETHLNIFINLMRQTVRPPYRGYYEEKQELFKAALEDKIPYDIDVAKREFIFLYKNIVKHVQTYGIKLSTEQKTSIMMIAKRLGINRNELQTAVSTVGSANRQY